MQVPISLDNVGPFTPETSRVKSSQPQRSGYQLKNKLLQQQETPSWWATGDHESNVSQLPYPPGDLDLFYSVNKNAYLAQMTDSVERHVSFGQHNSPQHFMVSNHSAHMSFTASPHQYVHFPSHIKDFSDPALPRQSPETYSRSSLTSPGSKAEQNEDDCFRDLLIMFDVIHNCPDSLSRVLNPEQFNIDCLRMEGSISALYSATDGYVRILKRYHSLFRIAENQHWELPYPILNLEDNEPISYFNRTQRLGPYPNPNHTSSIHAPTVPGQGIGESMVIDNGGGVSYLGCLCFQELLRIYDVLVDLVLNWHQTNGPHGFNHITVPNSNISSQTDASIPEIELLDTINYLVDRFENTIGRRVSRSPSHEQPYDQLRAASSDIADFVSNLWANEMGSLETSVRRKMGALRSLVLEREIVALN